jgi:PAS domain S-box-containing protein
MEQKPTYEELERRVQELETHNSQLEKQLHQARLFSERLTVDGWRIPVQIPLGLNTDDRGRPLEINGIVRDITERKRAEVALRESEQRFREWFESSPISLWEQDFSSIKKRIDEIKAQNVGDLDSYFRQQPELVWELAGMVRVLDVNQAALKLYRAKSKEDFWGGITKVFSRESLEGFLLVLEVIAAGEKTFVTEKEHLTLDGEPLKVQLYWKVAKGHEDTYSRILVSIIDVTDQKRAEERMRQSENYYRAIFETSGSAMFIHEEDTTISHVNSNFEKLLGYSKQEVEGKKSWTEFVHADDVSWMKENHYLLRRDPRAAFRSYEFRFFVRNGELRHGILTVDIIHDTSQSVVSLIDITERKRAEDALKESEEKYRDLFQSSIDGIAKSDLGGKIVDCNKAYLEMTGHSEEEIKSLTYRDLTPERWANVDREHLDQCLNRGYSDPYEKERIRKDGTVFPISIMIWLRRDSEGNLLGFWGIVRDITERKQAEEEREKLQAQLTQAQKLESVGRLAGGVAHDINNMLSVILGNTELGLQEVDSTQSLHGHLQEIQKAAQRSTDVVRQMLAFARKQTIAPEVLDLNETVEEMLKMLRRLIGEDIDLSWQPGHDIWPVKMDPAQIDQILANLSVNTRDAINGVGKLTIETGKVSFDETHCARHPYLVPGDFVLLAISDDGCGMDKETLDNIFEPFFTTKEVGQGTGLGLATVYGIVKQNNGFINVYSEPNQGTTFRIYLPRHRTGDDPVRAETSDDREVHGDETILLVEDETTILKMARMMLERLGYTVLTALTPGEAMEVAKEHGNEIHLLMTDVVMPEINGRELAEKLLSLYPNLKWLFMSGYTENAIAHHGVLDEGVHFIQKPFSMQKLSAKIRKVMDEED